MYVSSFMPLQTALSGVEAAQEELQTTSNNISNANTAGYEAERVTLTEAPSLSLALTGHQMQLGAGVQAQGISQASNPFLDAAYRNQSAGAGSTATTQTYLNNIQSVLGEPSGNGINAQLAKFWADWNSVASNPTSSAAKQTLINDGATLAGSFNQLSTELGTISSQATAQLNALTGSGGQLQSDASQIAQLNSAIQQTVQGGGNPNSLIDQRNQALDDLSSLGKITVTNNPNGTVTVGFGDAASPLVSGGTVNWPQTITGATGGTVGALLNLTGPTGTIAGYQSQLDAVAGQLASAVNNPTVNGSTVAVNPPFFSGTTASTLAVNATASTLQTSTTGAPGDNDISMAEAALSGGAPDSAYQTFVAQIGSDTQAAGTAAKTQAALKTSAGNQRSSVEGVDLSVEMTNLIQQQQAYQASAKVMNAFQVMMGSLMQTVGA